MPTETFSPHSDPDYSVQFEYAPPGDPPSGSPTLKRLWVDRHGSAWLESTDGSRVQVPREIRGLVAKRMKEATFR